MLEQFWQWQKQYQPAAYVLALSGGLDSVVLLHLLATNRHMLHAPLHACYVNHGWHHDAAQWAVFCAELCREWHIPFSVQKLSLPDLRQTSREAQARIARYDALSDQLPARGVLLTAHHQDDQAETLLLQLLRGAGSAGLSAMPPRKSFARGEHWRPLLSIARQELLCYAQRHHLRWINDPSNADLRYARNRLRYQVLPLLNDAFAGAAAQVARSAGWLAETQTLLDEAADGYLDIEPSAALDWVKIASLSDAWQRAIIRRWLQRQAIRPPGYRRLQELLRQLRDGRGAVELLYDEQALVFYRGYVRVLKHSMPSPAPVFAWQTDWPGVGRLVSHMREAQPVDTRQWRWALYPPGARFRPSFARHSKPLKHWFQQLGIAPYLRRRTPLLWQGDKLIWVGGIGMAAGVTEPVIDWQKAPHSANIPSNPQASD